MPMILRRPTYAHQHWSNCHGQTHTASSTAPRSYAASHATIADGRTADRWLRRVVASGGGIAKTGSVASADGAGRSADGAASTTARIARTVAAWDWTIRLWRQLTVRINCAPPDSEVHAQSASARV
jgi:hypothetical protein